MLQAAGGPPVCIKPNDDAQGSGVACLSTPDDVGVYALALELRLLTIPGTVFSSQPHADVHMRPGQAPAEFLLEFFVATDGCAAASAEGGRPCCAGAL